MFRAMPYEELWEFFLFFAEIQSENTYRYAIFNIGASVALWSMQGSFSQNFAKKRENLKIHQIQLPNEHNKQHL